MKAKALFELLWSRYPAEAAEEEDRAKLGLWRGKLLDVELSKAAVALDVDPAVVRRCQSEGISLLLVHHPVPDFFAEKPEDLMIFCLHTNFDLAPGGMRDIVSAHAGLEVEHYFRVWGGDYGAAGRVSPRTLGALAEDLKLRFGCSALELVGDRDRPVEKAALVAGDGFLTAASVREMAASGGDVLISGDINYLTHQYLRCHGLGALNIPHGVLERPGLVHLAGLLQELGIACVVL